MRRVVIEDYIEVLSGYAFSSKKFNTDGLGMPIIRIRDVGHDESETYFDGEFDSKYLINKGDMLIAMDGDFRLAKWTGRPSLLNQRVCKVKSISKDLLDEFLFYALPAELKKIEDATSYVTVKHLSVKKINAIEIPLPSLSEQKAIVAKLDRAQRLIDIDKAMLAKYDQLIQSVFLDMFGDPVTNPKGWEVKKLGDVGTLARGKSKHRPRNDASILGGDYPLIQTGDVANAGMYITSYNSTYNELGLKQSKKWEKGTLCITIAANIAKVGILDFDACFPDSVVGFKSELASSIYIYSWMGFLQSIIEEQAPVSAQKNINLRILNDLDVMFPPIDLQHKYEATVLKVYNEKSLVEVTQSQSEALFSSLVQGVFN